MVDHQEHFGKKFYQDKSTGYWISTTHPRIRAHVWVWKIQWGVVPKNYHIHHKNENKSDNRIENLELIERSRHMSHHMQDENRKAFFREWAAKIRPLTKAWHASEEGRLWHKYHAKKNNFGNWEATKHICIQCSSEYETKKRSNFKFCSNKCKSAWRRGQGHDNVQRQCILCNQEFTINKYMKTQTCSRSCAAKMRWIIKKQPTR